MDRSGQGGEAVAGQLRCCHRGDAQRQHQYFLLHPLHALLQLLLDLVDLVNQDDSAPPVTRPGSKNE